MILGDPHIYVEARLGRWSVWCRWGPRPGPRRLRSSYGPMILDPNVEQIGRPSVQCPVDLSEAEETQRAVMALERELRDAVCECYLEGGTIRQKSAILGITPRAFYYRLDRAYVRLLGYFNDLAAEIPLPCGNCPRRADAAFVKIA